ncbi:nuclear transport factor 2 family protein [Colwelliaceae bacterium 6441]
MLKRFLIMLVLLWQLPAMGSNEAIDKTLDEFHVAATGANFDKYFSLLATNSVFLGTDATERWTKEEFKTFVKPYFSKGKGWRYEPTQRNISLINEKNMAFFDELLINKNYGQCRGSGILIKENNQWKILQYNLSIPVPNHISNGVVSLISNASKLKQ